MLEVERVLDGGAGIRQAVEKEIESMRANGPHKQNKNIKQETKETEKVKEQNKETHEQQMDSKNETAIQSDAQQPAIEEVMKSEELSVLEAADARTPATPNAPTQDTSHTSAPASDSASIPIPDSIRTSSTSDSVVPEAASERRVRRRRAGGQTMEPAAAAATAAEAAPQPAPTTVPTHYPWFVTCALSWNYSLFVDMKPSELKALARGHGLACTGSKMDYLERLTVFVMNQQPPTPTSTLLSQFSSPTVPSLSALSPGYLFLDDATLASLDGINFFSINATQLGQLLEARGLNTQGNLQNCKNRLAMALIKAEAAKLVKDQGQEAAGAE